MNTTATLPPLPRSWSELSWQQLTACWQVKQRYGGNADVARAAALLALLKTHPRPLPKMEGRDWQVKRNGFDPTTGEQLYFIAMPSRGTGWVSTPRELSQMAKQALPWFDYPYGDPGEPAVEDEKGKVIKEARDPVRGYVSGMRDALILPMDNITISLTSYLLPLTSKTFALPQAACNNLTWQQYRSLQSIASELFGSDVDDEQAADLQAQFLAHCLVPRTIALFDTTGGSIRFRPHYDYVYNASQAEGLVKFWRKHLLASMQGKAGDGSTLFHICFQCYQTALTYYAGAYPLLFEGDGNKDTMRDALQGETGTINTIMKYAGYGEQQQVYDSNLPFVLDILNTMTKEAKEIERMNARIKKK